MTMNWLKSPEEHPHAKDPGGYAAQTDRPGRLTPFLSAIDLVDSSERLDRIWAFTAAKAQFPVLRPIYGFHDEVIAP